MCNLNSRVLEVKLPDKSYDIIISNNSLRHFSDNIIDFYGTDRKIAVISDSNVMGLYAVKLISQLEQKGVKTIGIEIPAGESSKSFESLQKIYDELLSFKMTRSDVVVAFGGGVIGDLTGFAASTYLRGVPFVQIPTTLLAQVDSSVGGKVAINVPQGKNLIGSFYQPDLVLIDPMVLDTLEDRSFADGMAEVIKYGCIRDAELFSKIEDCGSRLEIMKSIIDIIYSCCNIKRNVVQNDEKDHGERMILNFGHTIGHGIEKYFNYNKYTHGEAVAIGMVYISKLSEDKGISKQGTTQRIKKLLSLFNLPVELPDMDWEDVIDTVALDKKKKGNVLSLILLKRIGECIIQKESLEWLK